MLASLSTDHRGRASAYAMPDPGPARPRLEPGGSATAGTVRPPDGEPVRPAVTVTLSTSTRTAEARVLVYGRLSPGSGAGPAAATDADPARMLDRRMAEGRKEVAAIQIRQTKVAAKDAGVLALLDPAGALGFAKSAAKSLSHAMRTFGDAETTIRRTEDDGIAVMPPDEIKAIACDLYERTGTLEITEDGRAAIDAALARSQDRQAGSPDIDDPPEPTTSTSLTVTMRVEALTVVGIEDDSGIAGRRADVDAARSERMRSDADVIKDGVSGLRSLDGVIHLSTKRLQETGRMDARAAREAAEARTAWLDAVADTARAALPVVQAGYSITPNDEG